jgi:hypothetical protein
VLREDRMADSHYRLSLSNSGYRLSLSNSDYWLSLSKRVGQTSGAGCREMPSGNA